MSTFHLHFRTDPRSENFVKFDESFTDYRAAVLRGQQIAGRRMFFVSGGSGNFVPSREEQLLLEPQPKRSRASRRRELLEQL